MIEPSAVRRAAPTAVDYDPFAGGELSRVVPTTEPQRELWLAARLGDDASLAYNESVSLRLRGPLDSARLQQALQQVVARHDALRASFGPDGETFCVIQPDTLALPFVDIAHLSGVEREAVVAQHRRAGVETPFALEQGRLFRAELLRLAHQDHLLLMHAHHIVCDGWSWWVIVRELGAAYAESVGAAAAGLPEADSYADYALAEALHPAGPEFRRDEQYWLSRFQGEIAVLDLPTDRARPARRSFASLREDYLLDADLVSAVRRLGARRGASLFATLLGGFAALLSRIAGQDQVVIGIPAAGQSVDGHDHLVGHCVNLLPLRFDLAPAQSFADVLANAQETLLDAIEHQRYTFGTLLKKLRIARDPARLPLVSVMFNIDQALDQEKSGFPGLSLEFTTNPRSYENFELSVNAVQVDGRLRLECQYNRDLFDAATVRRWLSAYEALLRAAVERPEERVCRLALVDAPAFAELAALQPPAVAFDRECRMHEHFERQCDRAPERMAVRCGNQALTYRQLESRANRIAQLLRRHGVQKGALVGLAMDRGTDMLAALLGILKAGAGYVPLDPQFPADRLAYMASDAGLAALLTHGSHAAQFDLRGRPVLALDALEAELQALPDNRPGRDAGAADAESVAYVIYTSGSTGRPKGVQVPHRAVANFIAAMQRQPGLELDERLVAVTTLSFDIAVLELMLPLSVGAEVVLADKDTVIDGAALADLLAACRATAMQATPATWRLLLEAGWQGGASFKAMCGGEPLPQDLAQALLPRCGSLWNLYGPTETTVWSTCMRVQAAAGGAPDIHIGRPVANTQVWILDEHGQPCPRGVPGEICVGGEGVTLGYLDRPELTADRFLPDAFASSGPGFGTGIARPTLYRTGDRGRWRADGNLEHLGRLDFQVKVRGYRIELGEIENNLISHPALTRVVAMAREDRPGDIRLVAYVVAAPGMEVADAALAAHLRQHLPDYMVPQHFVRLDAIPLLPNGKVDRKALPAPDGRAAALTAPAGDTVAPRDALEAAVAAAMEAVLGRPGIGVNDGFFELGGHSLLAAQLCARLAKELEVPVPLRLLFDAPSPAKLAAALRDSVARPDMQAAAARIIPHRRDQSSAPMTLMQQRLWVFEQMDPGTVTYNTPSAHRLHGPMDLQAFERAFQEMLRRQASLRTIVVPEGDSAVQKVLDTLDFSLLPLTDLSALPEPQRMQTLMQDLEAMTAQPFVLDRAPLFRAKLYRLAEDDHVLYFMTHHIIWDGWSFDVFYSEMSALYAAFAAGKPSPLPELEVSYGDFAQWHQQRMNTSELDHQIQHWKRHLQGELEPLRLSEDYPRPAAASGNGSTEWVHVDRATTDAMREIGARSGATLFMTLLTAYYVLLHRLSGQDDLVVGLPFRNRNSEALEKVMGFFVNMLPLRLRLDPAMPFVELVKRVRAAVVEAFEYPDVPFEHLLRELKVPRDQSRSPIYQALFSFQDVRARQLRWGELQHEHLLMFQKGMSNDLGLWFLEHEQGLSGAMGYNTDIISAESAQAIHHRFVALLQSLCRDPGIAIGDAGILSERDRTQLVRWNSTTAAIPDGATVDGLLLQQMRRSPSRIAVRFGNQAISYSRLDTRSARIADALLARGVEPGSLVGVALDRHADLVAATIAVWRIGAAYVPLDPAYPAERLKFMAEDAQLALVISEGELAEPMGLPASRLLLLDRDAGEIDDAPPQVANGYRNRATADSLAYVIYTSGSTGKPKGVMVHHRAAVNFLQSMALTPGLGAEDRLLAVTTTSFDISVLELFLPLSVGAEVVLAERETAMDGAALAQLLSDAGITVMQATPSTWRLLLDADWKGRPGFKGLCGGEPLPPDLAMQLGGCCDELWNMYGPTETTVWSTCSKIVAAPAQAAPDIHIGQPIANTTVWILDPRGQLCPVGVSGEIHIGGAGVTQGYLHRPELTAERFIADPFAAASADASLPPRLYRTGDRGRWRSDGVIEHQGRLDHQIKLRGYRIELGEIENTLERHPDVASAAVVARELQPQDVRLIAYVVPRRDASLQVQALLAGLRDSLPAYMVPQHVVTLAALPTLPNGKTDRNALPVPVLAAAPPVQAGDRQGDAPARTPEPGPSPVPAGQRAELAVPVEPEARPLHADSRIDYLMRLWAELLGVAAGPDDNFFDLGGHSMLAIRMANRVARDTGVRLKLLSLATHNLAQVAASLPAAASPAARGSGGGGSGGSRILRYLKRLISGPERQQ
ncbi:amino acid adenylation domain-containing protein [Pseudoxanthomonas wuyuanensis]|uniref:Amino acid adenylation domain-containing protein n=1 Tax=Pseudoxanthomonas wuyuanensis TaxID=1073196 RepID=A0A286D9E0_9GAMM|nr:non-ribosomal peptide synthetase [Pseudoxanthomonas wuyuanensis]SOD55271.1 amino acid adenylation domain-containing protein [Pseudoxanthomonas wuyuanensis]